MTIIHLFGPNAKCLLCGCVLPRVSNSPVATFEIGDYVGVPQYGNRDTAYHIGAGNKDSCCDGTTYDKIKIPE